MVDQDRLLGGLGLGRWRERESLGWGLEMGDGERHGQGGGAGQYLPGSGGGGGDGTGTAPAHPQHLGFPAAACWQSAAQWQWRQQLVFQGKQRRLSIQISVILGLPRNRKVR